MTSDYVATTFLFEKERLFKCFSRQLTDEILEKFHTPCFILRYSRTLTRTYTPHRKLEPVPRYNKGF